MQGKTPKTTILVILHCILILFRVITIHNLFETLPTRFVHVPPANSCVAHLSLFRERRLPFMNTSVLDGRLT